MTDESKHSLLSTLAPAIAGPVAGACSRFVIYPSDTIKARLQVQGALNGKTLLYGSTLDAARQMVQQEGYGAFYRGFGIVVVGNVPANMAYFGGYELGKWLLPDRSGLLSNMATGAMAQLSGGLLFTPVDIIKERMQVQGIMRGQFSYTGSFHALHSLLQERGPLGLFRGYWATNAVWIPWSVLHIAGYEHFKGLAAQAVSAAEGPGSRVFHGLSLHSVSVVLCHPSRNALSLHDTKSSSDDLSPWMLGCCSAASASLASIITQPMDVVKTRLQVMNAAPGAPQPTVMSVARQALQQEGMQAFMSGSLARILTLAPGASISWMIYQPLMRLLQAEPQSC